MYTCDTCGARFPPGAVCGDCARAAKLLKLDGEDAEFLAWWIAEVARNEVEKHVDRAHRNHSDS